MTHGSAVTSAACLALAASLSAQNIKQLPDYAPSQRLSTTIRVCGSPQMSELMQQFEHGFAQFQPEVRFADDLQSTVTAVSGVYAGRADVGLLGREIWEEEAQEFAKAKGHHPLVVDIATGSYDVPKATFALMVFVPKANPLASISIEQLDRVFSSENSIHTWGELGLREPWSRRPIHLYGFEVGNDKSRIFSILVFPHGERWNPALKSFANEPGPTGKDAGELILDAVAKDPDGIAISNVHYATPEVKPLSVASLGGRAPAVEPSRQNVTNRTYPLTRSVYMVVDPEASAQSNGAVFEFLRYVLSRQGQQAVVAEGNYLPLTPEIAAVQLNGLPAR